MPPFVIGIAGGSGSGKTTLARRLARAVGPALVIQLDWYYLDLSHLPSDLRAGANFDHPEALDWPLLSAHLSALRHGRPVQRPAYDFQTHTRLPRPIEAAPHPVHIVEGILALHDAEVRAQLDLKVFVEAPRDLRLERRTDRDVSERGRSSASVAAQFEQTVDPMHARYVEPTRAHADILADGAGSLDATLEAITARWSQR